MKINNVEFFKLTQTEREDIFRERFKSEYITFFAGLVSGLYCLWSIIDNATSGELPSFAGIIVFAIGATLFWKMKRDNDALVDAYIGTKILEQINEVRSALWKIKALEVMDKEDAV